MEWGCFRGLEAFIRSCFRERGWCFNLSSWCFKLNGSFLFLGFVCCFFVCLLACLVFSFPSSIALISIQWKYSSELCCLMIPSRPGFCREWLWKWSAQGPLRGKKGPTESWTPGGAVPNRTGASAEPQESSPPKRQHQDSSWGERREGWYLLGWWGFAALDF